MYVREARKPFVARVLGTRFFMVELGDFPPIIQQLLETEGVPPFDPLRDACVSYRGRAVTITFLIEHADFDKHLKEYKGPFSRGTEWYLKMGQDSLHLNILGRAKGARGADGLLGKHGIGTNIGRLDVRLRTLSVGDGESNQREKGIGYTLARRFGHFECHTTLDGKGVYLGYYTKEEDAKFVTNFRRKNWKQLLQECEAFVDNNLKVAAHMRTRIQAALKARDDVSNAT